MAEGTKYTKTYYCLHLTSDEAEILMGLVQNPICTSHEVKPEDEPEELKSFRESIWRALVKVKHPLP